MSIATDQALVVKAVKISAQNARDDAGYGGRMDDGGASAMEQRLDAWLDGIAFAQTGRTKLYSNILEQARKENDPEYQEYLRLKEKFK